MTGARATSRRIGEVPVLEYAAVDAAPRRPGLLVYHGWTGRKEDSAGLANDLVDEGFFVIAADAVGHGERRREGEFVGLPQTMVRTAAEVDEIIAAYDQDPRVDTSRMGFLGYSMGGGIGLKYLAASGKRLRAVVSVITTPVWAVPVITPEGVEALKATYGPLYSEEAVEAGRRYAEAEQPLNTYRAMAGTPLLLLNGQDDRLVPPEGVVRFYDLLRAVAPPGQVKLVLYPGVGHETKPEMRTEALAWLKRHLGMA